MLTVLLLIGLWWLSDAKSRSSRTDWQRTLSVAVVIVTPRPVAPAALRRLDERLEVLEDQLAHEFRRYHSGPRPFRFTSFGPVAAQAPPRAGDGVLDVAVSQVDRWLYLSDIDRSVGLDASRYDSRVYVVARPPASRSVQAVEGYGEQKGRVGIVEVELSDAMVDMVLSVVAHELFHTLGAEDKYDASGATLNPEGLADPTLVPRFPQRCVEVMARNRPLAPGRETPLDNLMELGVGPVTAQEVGWRRSEQP